MRISIKTFVMPVISFSCPEDITSMPKTSCGYFCSGCKKDVIDFRNFSAEKIQDYLISKQEKTCGIFNPAQLSSPAQSQISTLFRIAVAVVFFLGLNTSQLFSQETDSTIVTSSVIEKTFLIYGQVFDENSISMPYAKVYIKTQNESFYIMADIDGNYKLSLPEKLIGQSVDLCVSFIGYGQQALHFDCLEKIYFDKPINFFLKVCELMGACLGYHIPIISKDPYEAGKTTISGEDIRHRP